MAPADFIELNRTFHELSATSDENDDLELRSMFQMGSAITWQMLLAQYRVVLLSEAGSGKTAEIRNAALRLRNLGRRAFFLRLEHAPNDFEEAFEVGTFPEFGDWLASEEEGWLLLDSVDEARLRSPLDFERAIRKLSKEITPALQRSHIVITSRTHAWRPKTDLGLCTNSLPYLRKREVAQTSTIEVVDQDGEFSVRNDDDGKQSPQFQIVTLDDLSTEQIKVFANAKGVIDTRAFIDEIERADALSFTSRPQDLLEVVEFWRDHGRIGSRLELMRNSIARRLIERDQNRAESRPMNIERALRGSRLVAGAATMAQKQTIRVPDGTENSDGLPITKILHKWDERDCSTLLGRPVFDEAIYGAVRFHHRSVREYLAAEWLHGLLSEATSRRSIESCLFREQYGLEVVVPSTRPLLPWLILLDERIRDRALRLAPELVFEGGDPSQLPLVTRRRLLREICASLAGHRANQPNVDFAAVQRFASLELADDIVELLAKHARNSDVLWLLLRMVWQGQISAALPMAKSVAMNRTSPKYPRIAAFRAIAAMGTDPDQHEVRESFLKERASLDRTWLTELVRDTQLNQNTLPWFLAALAKAKLPEKYQTDGLSDAVISVIQNASMDHVAPLVARLSTLLSRSPVVEKGLHDISKRYRWLATIAAVGVGRIISARHEDALLPSSLNVLYRFRMTSDRSDYDLRKVKVDFPDLVRGWPELRDQLFWFEVGQARKRLGRKKKERLTEWWRVSFGEPLWHWNEGDFDRVIAFIEDRPLLDDRCVALSLAFHLYNRSGSSRKQRNALRKAVAGNTVLENQLHQYLHPPRQTEQLRALKRDQQYWKRQQELRERRNERNHESWRTHLADNVEKLRDPKLPKSNQITRAQYYLYQQLQDDDGNHRWSSHNWKSLIKVFGKDVATAFRDGVVKYWRQNNPKLLSEGAEPNRVLVSSIFGLIGLAIEAEETPGWPTNLSEAQAERATRYATFELNGFPNWLPKLFAAYPDTVSRVLLNEARWELKTLTADRDSHYVLSDVSWHGAWLWEMWGPILASELLQSEPKNASALTQMLKVIQGSELPDEQIRDLAAHKCTTALIPEALAQWYAVWVGVDPAHGIPSLVDRINGIHDPEARLTFTMQFITHLLGGRHDEPSATRTAYRTASHLKALYLLMHAHIRRREDVERAGKGVYSPGLRDNAQDARERLFNLLKDIPGKEAYLALIDIAEAHPEKDSRPWIKRLARTKAEQDAEAGPWSIEQFVEFNEQLERTPANHRELFELAWMRLLDLKADLEEGDSSNASILRKVTLEADMRKYIGNWLREHARGRYSVPQEEEFADKTKPDMRFHGAGFDAPIPAELKLADNWTGPHLFERLANQLCGSYLRDARSHCGIFALVYRGETKKWALPNSSVRVNFDDLIDALAKYWDQISPQFVNAEVVRVIGIDLTRRDSTPTPS